MICANWLRKPERRLRIYSPITLIKTLFFFDRQIRHKIGSAEKSRLGLGNNAVEEAVIKLYTMAIQNVTKNQGENQLHETYCVFLFNSSHY